MSDVGVDVTSAMHALGIGTVSLPSSEMEGSFQLRRMLLSLTLVAGNAAAIVETVAPALGVEAAEVGGGGGN